MARRRKSYAKIDYPSNSIAARVLIDGKEELKFIDKSLQIGDSIPGGTVIYRPELDEDGKFLPWFKHNPCRKGLPCPVGTIHPKIKRNNK